MDCCDWGSYGGKSDSCLAYFRNRVTVCEDLRVRDLRKKRKEIHEKKIVKQTHYRNPLVMEGSATNPKRMTTTIWNFGEESTSTPSN